MPSVTSGLEREIELSPAVLRVRDWPGLDGPLVHVADPLASSDVAHHLGACFAPAYRVLSVEPRPGQAYQVAYADLLGVLRQFGFARPILVGDGGGCLSAVLVAAWQPRHAAGLVLIQPQPTPTRPGEPAIDAPSLMEAAPPPTDPPRARTDAARSLTDCPPDWQRLRARLTCRVLELDHLDLAAIASFLSEASRTSEAAG